MGSALQVSSAGSGKRLGVAFTVIAGLLLSTLVPAAAQPDTAPRHVVEHFQDGLLYTIQNQTSMDYETRVASVEALITETFDIPRIARSVIGPSAYRTLDQGKRDTYLQLFTRYIVATQERLLGTREGQTFIIEGEREGARQSVIVDAIYRQGDGSDASVSYVLVPKPNGWRIVDVVVDGAVSEVSLRRSEFSAVMRSQGIVGLMEELNKKIAELRQIAVSAGDNS